MEIRIRNCNNIDSGTISLIEGRLNIKYAINGTGKSTIATAIEVSNIPEKLYDLTPYKYLSEKPLPEEHQPIVQCEQEISKVAIFNQEYVDQYIFLPNELLENSFEIFVKTADYEERMANIQLLIQDIQHTFRENPDLDQLIGDLAAFISGFGKAQGYSKNGPIGKGIANGNKIEHIPTELIEYSPYIKSDVNAVWLTWQSKGAQFLDIAEQCPYCASNLHTEKKTVVQKVAVEYDSKYVAELQRMIGVFKSLDDYFTEPVKETISHLVNSSFSFSKEEINFLTEIKVQVEVLYSKLNEIKYINFGALKNVDAVIDALKEKRISINLLSHINSPYTFERVSIVNTALENVITQANRLQGEIARQKKLIKDTIEKHHQKINGFLESAGYNYKVSIIEDLKDNTYRMILLCKDTLEQINNVKLHLSFGERNAFALVLFMYKALKDKPDLIVLDDPISSFDKNKKYALMEMLFQGSGSLQGKTVMMLTHDFDPIIDLIHTSSICCRFRPNPVASFIWNEKGILTEKSINSSDVKSFYEIAEEFISGDNDVINKLIYMRRRLEAFGDKGLAWQLISNVFHIDREIPTIQGVNGNRPMTQLEIDEASNIIKAEIPEFDYNVVYSRAHNKVQMISLFKSVSSGYEKIQLYRIINHGQISDTVFKKFVDEAYHIENDNLFQLSPSEYPIIPDYIIQLCENGIKLLEEGE